MQVGLHDSAINIFPRFINNTCQEYTETLELALSASNTSYSVSRNDTALTVGGSAILPAAVYDVPSLEIGKHSTHLLDAFLTCAGGGELRNAYPNALTAQSRGPLYAHANHPVVLPS